MRFMMGMVLLLVMGLLTTNKAYAQVKGVTVIKIGVPTITAAPDNVVTVPFTMEIDSTVKSFDGVQAVVLQINLIKNTTIPSTLNWAKAPVAGMGQVNGTDTFTAVRGKTYQITLTMKFTNAGGMATSTNDVKTYAP